MDGSRALILLGHGSHLNPDSSAPVYDHAARIRGTGAFDEVLEAFWKEEPSLRDALDLVQAPEVFVVPLFLAEGYFTREVLPRELGLDGAMTRRSSSVVRYCRPVGTHPSMADLIVRRATEIAGLDPEQRRRAALVVIGHGTERSESSGDTVYALVERLRRIGAFGAVECGFLDEEPRIEAVVEGIAADDVVLVPFFVAEGWHTRETIPADLGLEGPLTRRPGRRIWYAPPVGTLPEVAELVLEIAEEAAVESVDPPLPSKPAIRAARESFFEWLAGAPEGVREFLQVVIEVQAEGRFAVRPKSGLPARRSDSAPDAQLRADLSPAPPPPRRGADPGSAESEQAGEGEARRDLARLSGLRSRALDLVRFTEDGRYRPLRTAPDLRRDWGFVDLDQRELWEVLGILYPAAVLHWHRFVTNRVDVVDYPSWAARQTAMYAVVRELPSTGVAELAHSLCEPCLRHRLWRIDGREASAAGARPDAAIVPCREPCTVFATAARERARAAPG